MLKLKLQYFGYLLWRVDSWEKILMLGKSEGGKRSWCWERLKAGEGDEEKVVGWHHRFNGHEFEQTPGDSKGQRSLGCFSPCGHKESDTTEGQNNNPVNTIGYIVLSAFVLTSRHPGPEIKIPEPRDCHTEWSKSDREAEALYDIPNTQNLKRHDTNELMYKTEMDS